VKPPCASSPPCWNNLWPTGATGRSPAFAPRSKRAKGVRISRSQLSTKAFGRLRERLGIGERLEGQRQASKDLHSLRRWHAARCRDAINSGAQGLTMYTLADNLGHAKGGLGLSMTSRYAGAESLEAKAKAVEAVRLPIREAVLAL
jgi:hypothetical protein